MLHQFVGSESLETSVSVYDGRFIESNITILFAGNTFTVFLEYWSMFQIGVLNFPLVFLFIKVPISDMPWAVHEHGLRYQYPRALAVLFVEDFEHLSIRLDPQDMLLVFLGYWSSKVWMWLTSLQFIVRHLLCFFLLTCQSTLAHTRLHHRITWWLFTGLLLYDRVFRIMIVFFSATIFLRLTALLNPDEVPIEPLLDLSSRLPSLLTIAHFIYFI